MGGLIAYEKQVKMNDFRIPVLLITFNRPEYTRRVLETVLGLVLLRGADDAIHHAVVRKLCHEARRDAQGVADHHALHGFKLGHKARLARRRVGLDEVQSTRGVVHFFLGEIVPSHPVGFLLVRSVLGLHRGSHQEQKSEN